MYYKLITLTCCRIRTRLILRCTVGLSMSLQEDGYMHIKVRPQYPTYNTHSSIP